MFPGKIGLASITTRTGDICNSARKNLLIFQVLFKYSFACSRFERNRKIQRTIHRGVRRNSSFAFFNEILSFVWRAFQILRTSLEFCLDFVLFVLYYIWIMASLFVKCFLNLQILCQRTVGVSCYFGEYVMANAGTLTFLHPRIRKTLQGLMWMWLLIWIVFHSHIFFKVIPKLPNPATATLILSVFAGLHAILFVRTSLMQPGTVPLSETESGEMMERGCKGAVCETCNVLRPIRSKHCGGPFCGNCYSRFDHHCVWLNKCVAVNNHLSFLITAILATLDMAVAFIFLMMGVVKSGQMRGSNTTLLWHLLSEEKMTLFSLIVVALMTFMTAHLVYTQISQIRKNITTNEVMNRRRYTYLWDDKGRFFNPFDHGSVTNFLEFLGYGGVNWGAEKSIFSHMDLKDHPLRDASLRMIEAKKIRKAEKARLLEERQVRSPKSCGYFWGVLACLSLLCPFSSLSLSVSFSPALYPPSLSPLINVCH